MIEKLNLLEWSLNLRSDKEVEPDDVFSNTINDMKPEPDILFLTETVKDNKNLGSEIAVK